MGEPLIGRRLCEAHCGYLFSFLGLTKESFKVIINLEKTKEVLPGGRGRGEMRSRETEWEGEGKRGGERERGNKKKEIMRKYYVENLNSCSLKSSKLITTMSRCSLL